MGKIIKVRCNGNYKHVNEIDLEKTLKTTVVTRNFQAEKNCDTRPEIPERVVLPCRECTEGKVIITRAMIKN